MDSTARVRFGRFELDRRAGELWKSGSRLRLQERPLRVLEALLERPGEIVTREELQRRLWSSDTFVDFDNGLNSAINRLRTALGDSAEHPQFIETVGRRGYRFIADVSGGGQPAAATPTTAVAKPPSVATRLAVLPFRQLKADRDTEFLATSLPDAIASSLSGLESLSVRSTLATARFATDAPDLAAMAAALDVTAVLAGTVLRVDDRVRVAVHLVEAPHGTLLWTSTAEATIDDLFCLTDGLVSRIVESLALPLTVRDTRALSADVPTSGRAYELYLRANSAGRTPDGWPRAGDLYEEALRVDPGYAPAWARLGRVHRLTAKYSGTDDSHLMARAEDAFRRALAINPELSIAHALYAQLEMESGRSLEAFARLLDRVRVRPADPQLFVGLVQAARYVGLLDVSRAAHTRAVRLDPTVKTSIAYTSFASGDHARAAVEARENDDPLEGFALAAMRRLDEGRAVLERTRGRYGANQTWTAYLDLVISFTAGDMVQARGHADVCLQTPFADPEGVFYVCLVCAWLNEPGRALIALRRAVDAGFSCLPSLTCDPALCVLQDLDEFAPLRSAIETRHQQAVSIYESAGGLVFSDPTGNEPT